MATSDYVYVPVSHEETQQNGTYIDSNQSTDALPRAFYAMMIIVGIIIESIVVSEIVEKLYEKYLHRLAEKQRSEKVVQLLKKQNSKRPEEALAREAASKFRRNVIAKKANRQTEGEQRQQSQHQDTQQMEETDLSHVPEDVTTQQPQKGEHELNDAANSNAPATSGLSALLFSSTNNDEGNVKSQGEKGIKQRMPYTRRVVISQPPSEEYSEEEEEGPTRTIVDRDIGKLRPPKSKAPGGVNLSQSRPSITSIKREPYVPGRRQSQIVNSGLEVHKNNEN